MNGAWGFKALKWSFLELLSFGVISCEEVRFFPSVHLRVTCEFPRARFDCKGYLLIDSHGFAAEMIVCLVNSNLDKLGTSCHRQCMVIPDLFYTCPSQPLWILGIYPVPSEPGEDWGH